MPGALVSTGCSVTGAPLVVGPVLIGGVDIGANEIGVLVSTGSPAIGEVESGACVAIGG